MLILTITQTIGVYRVLKEIAHLILKGSGNIDCERKDVECLFVIFNIKS